MTKCYNKSKTSCFWEKEKKKRRKIWLCHAKLHMGLDEEVAGEFGGLG